MEGAFTFLWRVENYSHCLQKTGEVLASPVFVVDDLNETQWRLHLYPRGLENDRHVNLYICRENNRPCGKKVHYELSFLTADDGTYLIATGCAAEFQKNAPPLLPEKQIERKEFEGKKALLLKEDVLTIRCRLWRSDGRRGEVVRCLGLSRIFVERRSIVLAIEEFSTRELNENWHVRVQSAAVMHPPLTLTATLVGKSVSEARMQVGVTLVNTRHPKLLTCTVSVLDGEGKAVKESKGRDWLDIKRGPQSWAFPEVVIRKELLQGRDVLVLRCECAISSGVELQRIEGTHYEPSALISPDITSQDDSAFDKTATRLPMEELCDPVTVLQDDLRSLYARRTLSDLELRSGDASFPVHRCVLSARSTAFRDMFERTIGSDVLEVPDVDGPTLDRMLTFLYTGTSDHLLWEDAAKLYYAADKYEVLSLKQICSSLLGADLGVRNVGELLQMATRHGDDDLRATAVDYILRHDDEVISSAEWRRFMECDLKLAAKTLHEVFSIKEGSKEELKNCP